ncbi:MAG: Eco29kI family restriction endonuclease [Magnetococcales bacterium]|nr:Eco29kI family restriction endonuclease [Magnetococcales bacterium]
MIIQPFDRKKHIYRNDDLIELVKDAVRFFNGTPVHTLPPPENFTGTGVYALYYTGKCNYYERYAQLNRLAYSHPIYVGKAVPKGWRQARTSDIPSQQSNELYRRLMEHSRNIEHGSGIEIDEFMCRFAIFEATGSDMIGTIEAALIKINMPLWNTMLDGFGNHDPGKGRYQQSKSEWDVIHPGREWANRCQGVTRNKEQILSDIRNHMNEVR